MLLKNCAISGEKQHPTLYHDRYLIFQPMMDHAKSEHKGISDSSRSLLEEFNSDFQSEDLEVVSHCPVCSAHGSTFEISGTDHFFRSSELFWPYHRCSTCKSLFMQTRPKEQYIGRAYSNYYTHADLKPETRNLPFLERVSLSYLTKDSAWQGFVSLLPLVSDLLNARTRHIRHEKPGRIFDFGCGNGAFLSAAQAAGWICQGMDLDEAAVRSAIKQGLDVSVGSTESIKRIPDNHFDYVTASHVLEHTYRPHDLIAELYRIVKPGGTLWIETPNASSFGASLFRGYWRGLESPRHIFIPSREGLDLILTNFVFAKRRYSCHVGAASFTYGQSLHAWTGFALVSRLAGLVTGMMFDVLAYLFKRDKAEFLTVICKKPR